MSLASELTNQIIHEFYTAGAFAWRQNTGGIFDRQKGIYRTASKKGVADILACYRGILIAVEVKIGKDRLSPEQEGFLKNVTHAGGIAIVVRNFEEFKEQWINYLTKEN